MKRAGLKSKISYRLKEEEWTQIDEAATAQGISAHDWCRIAAIEKLRETHQDLSGGMRIVYEEIARVRYLLGNAFGLLSGSKLTSEEWKRLLDEADKKSSEIAETLLSRRQPKESKRGSD